MRAGVFRMRRARDGARPGTRGARGGIPRRPVPLRDPRRSTRRTSTRTQRTTPGKVTSLHPFRWPGGQPSAGPPLRRNTVIAPEQTGAERGQTCVSHYSRRVVIRTPGVRGAPGSTGWCAGSPGTSSRSTRWAGANGPRRRGWWRCRPRCGTCACCRCGGPRRGRRPRAAGRAGGGRGHWSGTATSSVCWPATPGPRV